MWRDTARPAKIGLGLMKVDARLSFFLLFFIFHIREWTAILSVSLIALFWLIEKFGLTFDVALLFLRAFMVGKSRVVSLSWTPFMRYYF